jgi:hypothetical protein
MILIQKEGFAEGLDMSGRITGQVWKSLLESSEKDGHIRFPKLDTPVCQTRYSGFGWIGH